MKKAYVVAESVQGKFFDANGSVVFGTEETAPLLTAEEVLTVCRNNPGKVVGIAEFSVDDNGGRSFIRSRTHIQMVHAGLTSLEPGAENVGR